MKRFELVDPTEDRICRLNQIWYGKDIGGNRIIEVFEDEAPIDIKECEFYKKLKESDEFAKSDKQIKDLFNQGKVEEALCLLNKVYSTRLNTKAIAEDTSWYSKEGNVVKPRKDIDCFIQLCKDKTGKYAYSFSTKVYSFLDESNYPILDSYSVTLLRYYLEKASTQDIGKPDHLANWGNYSKYKAAYDRFIEIYELNGLSYKQIDIYLWLMGKILQDVWSAMGVLQFTSISYDSRYLHGVEMIDEIDMYEE